MSKPSPKKGTIKEGAKAEPGAAFIEARLAKEGGTYVNWSMTCAMNFMGRFAERRQSGGPPVSEPVFECLFAQGDVIEAMGIPGHQPIKVDTEKYLSIMELHKASRKRSSAPSRGPKMVEVEVVDEDTGVKTVKMVEAPRRVGKPRVGTDQKTGCVPGSDAHAIGLIMLDIGPRKDFRAVAVERLIKELGKPKALVQSWISTHMKRKPEIYGGLQL